MSQIVHYDKTNDILYLGIKSGQEEEFVEISPGIGVELDEDGKVIGMEVINASYVFKSVLKPMQEVVKV